jgi:hypothetical protein
MQEKSQPESEHSVQDKILSARGFVHEQKGRSSQSAIRRSCDSILPSDARMIVEFGRIVWYLTQQDFQSNITAFH